MALVYIDGFDHYALAEAGKKGWNPAAATAMSTSYGRRGTQGVRFQSTSQQWMSRTVPADDVYTIGFALRHCVTQNYSYSHVLKVGDSSVDHLAFFFRTDGLLAVNRGSTGIGSSPVGFVPANTWLFVELKFYIADGTSGWVEAKCLGNTWTLSSVDTRNAGVAIVNRVEFGCPASATYNEFWIDDLYLCDNTGSAPYDGYLGEIYVDTVLPDADGDVNDWTANTGNRYQAVDDPADIDDETTYVSETVNESKQLFSLSSLASNLGSVIAVQEVLCTRKDASPTVNVRPLFRNSGDSDYEGGLITLTDSYVCERKIWEKCPDDSAQWEPTDIDNGQFGMIFTYTTTTSA